MMSRHIPNTAMHFHQKMNRKIITTAVILMIVCIPIYSSAAMASFLQITDASGEDEINGYIRDKQSDILSVKVNAVVDGDEDITPGQVRYGGRGSTPLDATNPGTMFDQCVYVGPHHECTFATASLSSFTNPKDIRVYLYDDAQLRVAQDSERMYTDELAPSIESFTASPSIASGGDVSFSFSVKDYACSNPACANRCSGIDRLELTAGSYSATIDVNYAPDHCSYTGTVDVPLLQIEPNAASAVSKTIAATITAYDNLGKQASRQVNLAIDTTIPSVQNLELKANGNDLTHIGDTAVAAQVSATIVGDNIDTNRIYADLSELNINQAAGYTKGSCSSAGDQYRCIWPVNVELDSVTTANIRINASDTAGNSVLVVFSKNIQHDTTGPEITAIETEHTNLDDVSFLGSGNNEISLSIQESGIGLYGENIQISIAGQVIQPEECTPGWSCTYDVVAGSAGRKTLQVTGTDDLGNPATGIVEKDIVVDLTNPSYISHSVENIGAQTYEGIIKTGDALSIEINVRESNEIVNAYADLSSIIDGADSVLADSCTSNGDVWTCNWATTPIDVSGDIDGRLTFSFVDPAGNQLEKDVPIQVVGFMEAGASNYWNSRVECSPDRLDREITPLVSTRSFCHIYLDKIDMSSDQEPLSVELGQCTGDAGFISNIELMNNQQGSREPFIKLTLARAEATLNDIRISCPINIISRVGNLITTQEETENIPISIAFYNNPLGEIGDSLKDKIDEVDEINDGLWKWVGILKKIMDYAGIFCKFWNHLSNIIVVFEGITTIMGNAEAALTWFPAGKEAMRMNRIAACSSGETIRQTAVASYEGGAWGQGINTLCAMVNCKMAKSMNNEVAGWEGWAEKLGGGGGIDLNRWPGSQIVKDYTGKSPNDYMDVKNSIVLSAFTLCVPGIIYNLEKYRQIECMYGTCLLAIEGAPGAGTPAAGVPLSVCEDQKDYMTCKYVVGEVFRAIPFVAVFDHYVGLVKSTLSDPLAIVGAALAYSCMPECTGGEYHWPYKWCVVPKMLAMVGEAVRDVYEIMDKGWTIQNDYCEVFDDMKSEFDYEEEGEDDSWF